MIYSMLGYGTLGFGRPIVCDDIKSNFTHCDCNTVGAGTIDTTSTVPIILTGKVNRIIYWCCLAVAHCQKQ